ncbi:hypothetical protein [Nonomuraea salmonea]|uniref:hypothetical protein n=1 Tax=Nonomuraea salmonea TaxID=46181 RepID=UPI002FE82CCF
MASVCVGPEFEVDDQRRLRVALAGRPTSAVWPYPCASSGHNPLRVDPEAGLWAPPYPKIGQGYAKGETGTTHKKVPASWTEVDVAQIEVTNPSPCHSALVVAFVNADVDLFLPAGADARGGWRLATNTVLAIENPAPGGGTNMAYHQETTLVFRSVRAGQAGRVGGLRVLDRGR